CARGDGFTVSKALGEIEGTHDEVAAAAEEKEAHAFEIDSAQVI
ncbi:DNA repair helicase XPB1, partial [Trifolium medium]|nr:DNA repair helicase XPB1 [Trifolium medium]